jgi:hypothetical protein
MGKTRWIRLLLALRAAARSPSRLDLRLFATVAGISASAAAIDDEPTQELG